MAHPVASDRCTRTHRPHAEHPERRDVAPCAGLLGSVLLGCAVLTGCQAATSDNVPSVAAGHASTASSAGQVALAVPVELRQVLETGAVHVAEPKPANDFGSAGERVA